MSEFKIVLKAFDSFFCHNKYQIMIIKLLTDQFLQKKSRKELIFIS